jgi:pilus assembly protein Flp/PilA
VLNVVKRFFKEEDGATMVEYGIMIAAIAAICVATIFLIGGKVKQAYVDTNAAIP